MDLSFVTRKFQRSIAGLSLLAILASFAGFTGTAFASSFDDVSSSYFAYDQIDALSDAGIMTGYENGKFGPDDVLTREQAAKILVEAFVGSVDSSYDAGFSDVEDGMWYTDYVNTAALYGIVEGYADASGNPTGVFGVGDTVNRAEFAKMSVSAAGLDSDGTDGSDIFNDVASGAWFDSYVGTAYAYSIVDGTSSTTFSPANGVTRGQAAKMTYNSMYPVYRGDSSSGETGNNGSADATVMVEVSDDTPEADTLPSGATSVSIASFDFTAEGDDSELDGLVVHQYGISSVPSGATVYLYEGSSRLTNGTTVNSSTHESNFRNLNLELPEGETVTLTVRMDMGTWSSTGEVGFEIASADDVDVGDSSVEGDFAVQGEKFSVSTTSAGSVTVEKNGSVDNAQVGEDDAYVAKFKLTASSTEGGYVQELGLYLAGTVSTADVENFRLYVTGNDAEPVAQVDEVDSLDVVRFVIGEGDGVMDDMEDGYHMEKGESKSFYVLADFNTGRSGDTVTVYIDQNTDVRVVGDLYGYGMSVYRGANTSPTPSGTYDGTSCTSSSGNCTYQALEGGDITVSSNGPAANDVAINGKDVTLLNFIVTSVTDVTFDNFPIQLQASESSDTTEGLLNGASTANFTDIKIMDTDSGSQIYSSIDSTSLLAATVTGSAIDETTDSTSSNGFYLWTDDWYVAAGSEYNLAIQTDVANTSTLDGMTIVGALPFDGTYPVLKDVNNKTLTNSTVLVPNASITGKTMTVKSPSLTLSLASTPSSEQTFVKGKQNVQYTGIVFACGASNDCKVTDITLQGYYDSNGGANSFSTTGALSSAVGSVSLVDGDGNTVAASKSVNSSTSVVTYNNINWTIDAGDTEIVYVTGNLSSDATTSANIAFGISSASNVTVENEDGNSFSATGTVNATTQSTYVTVSSGGTLTVAVSSSTAREDIVVAGTSDVEISSFELTSTREAFTVSKLSMNNRQSAATTAALGNYDNNVSSVTIEYENSDGNTESKTGYLVSGTAQFTGLDLYVPADDTTTVTVYATLNSITSSGSTAEAGEFVDLAMAFDSFEALSSDSGSTYKVGNLDADTANLSIGTITWTDGSHNIDTAVSALAAASADQTLVIDDGAGATPATLPVGTLLCVSSDTTCTYASESAMVVTGWTAGSTDATVTTRVLNYSSDVAFADGDNVVYSLPGTGYFTTTNQMVVYESKPTLALSSSSPSGSRSVSASDDAFIFTITANSKEKIQVRPAIELTTCLAGNSTVTVESAADTTAAEQVDGSGCNVDALAAADDFVAYATTDLGSYAYASFWIRWVDSQAADNSSLDVTEIEVGCNDDNASTVDHVTAVAASNIVGAPSTLLEGAWYQVYDVVIPTACTSSDTHLDIQFAGANDSGPDHADDDVFLDKVLMYNEKLTIDLASDGHFDADVDGDNTHEDEVPLVAYLKEGSSTVATGYIDVSAGLDPTDVSTAVLNFYPISGTNPTIEIAKGTTKTYTVNTSTSALLAETSGVDDNLTFSIDYGSSSSGTVTAGDFWWYETNATVKWLGNVSSTQLTSNTVRY